MIVVGSRWIGRDAANGLSPVRPLTVTSVEQGKYHFDGGQNRPWPPDEIGIRFDDGQVTSCGASAFLRTYVPLEGS